MLGSIPGELRPAPTRPEPPVVTPRGVFATMSLEGHLWSIVPTLRHAVFPVPLPAGEPWSVTLDDPRVGPVPIRGRWHPRPGAETAIVVVHGLGGNVDAFYCRQAARAALAAGAAVLRLGVRGADRSGVDFPHAGLSTDLHAALAAPELAAYPRLALLGFSMGGHTALITAAESREPRFAAVAAICPPLDLRACQRELDRPARLVYRRHILRALVEIYAAVDPAGRPWMTPLAEVRRVRTFYDFDRLVVVPRHGFDSTDDYYTRASAGPRLAALRRPALVVAALADPLVPHASLLPFVDPAPTKLVFRSVARGGHVAFPAGVDLGLGPAAGAPRGTPLDQIVRWLLAVDDSSPRDP